MKNTFKNYRIFILLVLALSLVLSSCGSSDEKFDNAAMDSVEKTEGETIGTTDSALGNGEITQTETKTKIIRDVNITGETKSFDEAVSQIKDQIAAFEGYIEKSDVSGGRHLADGRHTAKNASFVIRIPADKLDGFLNETNALLNVTHSTESTKDVTLDYYDIKSRLDTLKTKKTALENMLKESTSLNDMLLIQDDLYRVIADIEAYQSKLNLYDNKVNYSTVTLNVREVVEYTVLDDNPAFGERIKTAFKDGWRFFGDFCEGFAVFVVGITPILIIAVIVITVILIVNAKKKAKKKNSKEKEE